jgi:hypothetical protein
MKADDPRLETSREEMIERVNHFNDMMLTVLKNHLVVEQFMNEFLMSSGEKADGKFVDKIQHCENLKPQDIEPPIWKVLNTGNQLRNKIAHTLDRAEIKKKVDEMRAAYLAALTDQQRPHSEKLDDLHIVAAAFELCGAYLVAANETIRSSKKS